MRGQKYSDEVKEKAYLMYATSGNINEVSRELDVPYATIAGWLKAKEKDAPDEFDKLRDEKKRDFIEKSSDIIDKGLDLLDRRIDRALNQETELDMLIDEIFCTDKDELSPKEKESLIRKVRALQLQDVKSITTAIGTLYDKRALAKGESTAKTTVEIKLPEEVDDYAG